MPILIVLMAYSIDFGYFYMAAASITMTTSNAAEYSVQGYQTPSQSVLASAGPFTSSTTVSGLAIAGLSSLISSSTTTTVQVCSKANGMSGNITKCTSYGPAGTNYTPATDPEAPIFVLQRVDVTYMVQPPIPLSFFKFPLIGKLQFHHAVSMRAMD